jgi:hypothetical protein
MIFGTKNIFAIEIGECERRPGSPGPYVQFRFWVGEIPIGDWNDRISIIASTGYASTLCSTEFVRRRSPFPGGPPSDVFGDAYDAFFSHDYATDPVVFPNLRDRYHLDEIGMGAVQDKYGLILVATTEGLERVIVRDLRSDLFIADVWAPLGFAESVLNDYVKWGRSQLLPAGG